MRQGWLLLVLALGCSSRSPAPTTTVGETTPEEPGPYPCNGSVGLVEPLQLCSEAAPCTDLLATVRARGAITGASDVPTCTAPDARGGFHDGPPQTRVDADGTTRYTCVYLPSAATETSRLPLVLFFHGAGGSADNVYGLTSLRRKAASYAWGEGQDAPGGFVLASIQGRNLHWPTPDPRDAAHHDVYHRDLGSPSSNPDIANADAVVDALLATGRVDPTRIYAMGWSNGGFFAELYAIARHETATPGGHRVAAAAVFGAADPFRSPRVGDAGRCDQSPVPHTTVPIAIVSRTCDIIPCDEQQARALASPAHAMLPGATVRTWTVRAGGELGDPNVVWRILNVFGSEVDRCTYAPMCPFSAAYADHVRWPDGVSDESHEDHEIFMLDFLRTHPRASE